MSRTATVVQRSQFSVLGPSITAVFSVLLLLSRAVAFTLLWQWFVVPFRVAPLDLWLVIGLTCLFGLIRSIIYGDRITYMFSTMASFVRTVLLVGVGYFAHIYLHGNSGGLQGWAF